MEEMNRRNAAAAMVAMAALGGASAVQAADPKQKKKASGGNDGAETAETDTAAFDEVSAFIGERMNTLWVDLMEKLGTDGAEGLGDASVTNNKLTQFFSQLA